MTCDEVMAFKGRRKGVSDTEIIVISNHVENCRSCMIVVQEMVRQRKGHKYNLRTLQRLNRRIETDPELQYLKN